MKVLEIKNVSKAYHNVKGSLDVVNNLNLDVEKGEIICIVGPSGGGKSTILNMISGLINPDQGEIKINGKIGYMFQHDLLFEWRSIEKNLTIGLEINHEDKANNLAIVDELLKKYDLYEFKKAYPSELSGGMRQRIALIRTLVTNPNVLLLDEPFSALDAQTRIKISDDIYQMIKEANLTAIMVTHDISEAISMADRVIVLSKRPAKVLKEYIIDIEASTPLGRRNNPKFNQFFQSIWSDLSD